MAALVSVSSRARHTHDISCDYSCLTSSMSAGENSPGARLSSGGMQFSENIDGIGALDIDDISDDLTFGRSRSSNSLGGSFSDVEDIEQLEQAISYFNAYNPSKKGTSSREVEMPELATNKTKSKGKRKSSAVPPFLEKLHNMLSNEGLDEYIAWNPDGTSVIVKKVAEFSKVVLPLYFKHDKFTSFLRQMNMYNFYTTRQMPNMRQFSNPLFRKNAKDGIKNIKRKRAAPPASSNASYSRYSGNSAKNVMKRQKLVNRNVSDTALPLGSGSKTLNKHSDKDGEFAETIASKSGPNGNKVGGEDESMLNVGMNETEGTLGLSAAVGKSSSSKEAKCCGACSIEIAILKKVISNNQRRLLLLEQKLDRVTTSNTTMQQILNILMLQNLKRTEMAKNRRSH